MYIVKITHVLSVPANARVVPKRPGLSSMGARFLMSQCKMWVMNMSIQYMYRRATAHGLLSVLACLFVDNVVSALCPAKWTKSFPRVLCSVCVACIVWVLLIDCNCQCARDPLEGLARNDKNTNGHTWMNALPAVLMLGEMVINNAGLPNCMTALRACRLCLFRSYADPG